MKNLTFIILILTSILMLGIACKVTKPDPVPPSPSASNSITAADKKVSEVRVDLNNVIPFVPVPQKPIVEGADAKLGDAQTDLKEAKTQSDQKDKEISEFRKNEAIFNAGIDKLTGEVQAAKQETADAKREYHDAWLGGKAWRLIYWIGGTIVLLLILDAVLKFPFNPVVWVLKLFGKAQSY